MYYVKSCLIKTYGCNHNQWFGLIKNYKNISYLREITFDEDWEHRITYLIKLKITVFTTVKYMYALQCNINKYKIVLVAKNIYFSLELRMIHSFNTRIKVLDYISTNFVLLYSLTCFNNHVNILLQNYAPPPT